MQSPSGALQTEFEKQNSKPERVLEIDSVDESSEVLNWGTVQRRADAITSGNVSVVLQNVGQEWNGVLSAPENNFLDIGEMKIGYTAISFMTVFKGKLERARFKNKANINLTFRDRISYFTKRRVGSSQSPADYFTSTGVQVTDFAAGTTRDWSAGVNPAVLVWSVLTNSSYGNLDSTESVANSDINWTAFSDYKNILDSMGYKIQANIQGMTIESILKYIAELTISTFYSEITNESGTDEAKITCKFWLGQDNASVQTYTSAKWKEPLPPVENERLSIINKYQIYYGYTVPQTDNGTATAGAPSTLTDGGKAWTVNAYRGYVVHITGNTGVGQTRIIASNTATVLTITLNWATNPDATSTYEVYKFDDGEFAGSETDSDATSITDYGEFDKVFSSFSIWLYDSASVTAVIDRKIIDTKDPIQYTEFTGFLGAYRQQLFDALKLTESFYSWSAQGFRIEGLGFNLNNGTVKIKGRTTTLFDFLILDDAIKGKLDSVYVLA